MKDKTAGISALGVTFGYAPETTAGEKPTEGWKQLTRINEIGDAEVSQETIDASALEDKVQKNIEGRSTISDTLPVTVNRTPETIAEWKEVIKTYEALDGGKRMWFQTITPGFLDAEFVVAAPPRAIPISGKSQNSLQTMVMNLVIKDFIGTDAKVDFTPGE